jgi:hypothetical protein
MLDRIAANGVRTILESPDHFARDLTVQFTGHDFLIGVDLIPTTAPARRGTAHSSEHGNAAGAFAEAANQISGIDSSARRAQMLSALMKQSMAPAAMSGMSACTRYQTSKWPPENRRLVPLGDIALVRQPQSAELAAITSPISARLIQRLPRLST